MNRLLAVTASLFLLAVDAAAVERVLVFDDVKKTDLQATFQSDCMATQPLAPDEFQKMQRVPTKANAFFLYFDPTVIKPARFGKFFDYPFYVTVAGANPAVWYSCGTQVYTQGAFLDRSETVHFNVQVGHTTDDGAIDVPLHSIANRDFLEITSVTTQPPARSGSAGRPRHLGHGFAPRVLGLDHGRQAAGCAEEGRHPHSSRRDVAGASATRAAQTAHTPGHSRLGEARRRARDRHGPDQLQQ